MLISNEKPPIWDRACEAFGIKEGDIVFFTYGNVCYNPSGVHLTDDLIRHEETHVEQQMGSNDVAKLWWERILRDPQFRLEQEGEAYGEQYKFICQKFKDRNTRVRNLYILGQHLSSPLYGNICTLSEAMSLIKENAEAKPDYESA